MPKKHHTEPGEKNKRKKGPVTKGQQLKKDLRAEKKKLKSLLQACNRDLKSLGIGKKKKATRA